MPVPSGTPREKFCGEGKDEVYTLDFGLPSDDEDNDEEGRSLRFHLHRPPPRPNIIDYSIAYHVPISHYLPWLSATAGDLSTLAKLSYPVTKRATTIWEATKPNVGMTCANFNSFFTPELLTKYYFFFRRPADPLSINSMSCLTCSNCGFVNLLPPVPHIPQILNSIQSSDEIVSRLLRGSQPLLDADHAFLDAEITNLKRLRSWYDTQLQEIEFYRRTVMKELKNREFIYAPIRRLPRDILIEIFHSICDFWWQDYQEQYEDDFERDSLDVTGPLWVLGRVSGLWRNILHTSPASWARYILVTSPLYKHAREILQTYLNYTGEHPLSLVIILEGVNLTREGEVMPLLVQSYYRWKNVRIHTTIAHTRYLESISHLPILQTIDINIMDVHGSDYSSDMCLNAPQLWQATLSRCGIHQIRLPPTITHYSGHITDAQDLQLLSQLPKLRTCHVKFSRLVLGSKQESPVVIVELCQLYITDAYALNFLTAPMLQSLTIAGGSPASLSCIPTFFRRSGCHLESFSIGMAMTESKSSTMISDVFSYEACSSISHLKLEIGSMWRGKASRAFASSFTPSSILPNLQHLVLGLGRRYYYDMTEWSALLDMIRSRCKARLLKVIEVQFDQEETSYLDGDIKPVIQALVGDNLEMRVEKQSPLSLDHRSFFWGQQPSIQKSLYLTQT
ncbi:hypothetical protein IW262DRAFT_1465509 [Armillaria fumosa]|nr:hypothetical protein IW262DRAFT_1465509 [Armillaria fumosa]